MASQPVRTLRACAPEACVPIDKRSSNSHTSVVLPVLDDKPLTATMMGRRSFMNSPMKEKSARVPPNRWRLPDQIAKVSDCRDRARPLVQTLSATVPRSPSSKRSRRQYGPETHARSARLPFRLLPRPRHTHPDLSLYARTPVGPGTVPALTRRPLQSRIQPNSHPAK